MSKHEDQGCWMTVPWLSNPSGPAREATVQQTSSIFYACIYFILIHYLWLSDATCEKWPIRKWLQPRPPLCGSVRLQKTQTCHHCVRRLGGLQMYTRFKTILLYHLGSYKKNGEGRKTETMHWAAEMRHQAKIICIPKQLGIIMCFSKDWL